MILKQNWKVLCFLLLSVLLPSSCQTDEMLQDCSHSKPVTVGIYAGDALTRTTVLPDGLSAIWQPGDQLAAWARNSAGDFTLQNQIFKTFGLHNKRGFFTSTLAAAMPEGEYTYYVSYPAPTSVNDTQATFWLSSTQDGKVSNGADIMLATPVQHGPMTSISESDDQERLSLQMNRMMHQFRFYVPSEDTKLNGGAIKRIVLSFPTPVVGNVQLDFTNPSRSAILLSGYRDVNINLEEPLTREAQNFACVSFVPTKFTAGQYLDIKAYTDDMIVELDPIDLCAKNCLAGHSTPVMLIVKALKEYPWQIKVRLSANNLGENVKSISFKAPGGCVWPNSNSNVYTYNPGREINVGDEFIFRFADEAQYRAFSKQNIAITYDSDNAITYQNVTMPDLSVNDKVSVSLTVPYLFYEDFAGLAAYDGDYKDGPYTSVDNASKAAKDLGQYGLPGWSGARTGCDAAGVAIAVSGRVDWVSVGATRAYGRLDSPAMTSLKPGANVNLELTFNYSGSRDGASKYSHAAVVGTTIDAGLLNGYATQFNNNTSWSGVTSPNQITNIPTNGSAAAANLSMTSRFEDCTSETRLTWHVVAMGKGGVLAANNANTWLYVDNVKVKIAK